MDDHPFVWKFDVFVTHEDGRRMPRTILVPASTPEKACAILLAEHPGAELEQMYGLATPEELHASGGAFVLDEKTRLVVP